MSAARRDMRAELMAWRRKRSEQVARQRAMASLAPPPFRVKRGSNGENVGSHGSLGAKVSVNEILSRPCQFLGESCRNSQEETVPTTPPKNVPRCMDFAGPAAVPGLSPRASDDRVSTPEVPEELWPGDQHIGRPRLVAAARELFEEDTGTNWNSNEREAQTSQRADRSAKSPDAQDTRHHGDAVEVLRELLKDNLHSSVVSVASPRSFPETDHVVRSSEIFCDSVASSPETHGRSLCSSPVFAESSLVSLSLYMEQASLPRSPPPTPATPSAALAAATLILSKLPESSFAKQLSMALCHLESEPGSPKPRTESPSMQFAVGSPVREALGGQSEALPRESTGHRDSVGGPLSPLSLESPVGTAPAEVSKLKFEEPM